MKRKYTIELTLSDAELWLLRRLYGRRSTTQAKALVEIAVRRAIVAAAEKEVAEAVQKVIKEGGDA